MCLYSPQASYHPLPPRPVTVPVQLLLLPRMVLFLLHKFTQFYQVNCCPLTNCCGQNVNLFRFCLNPQVGTNSIVEYVLRPHPPSSLTIFNFVLISNSSGVNNFHCIQITCVSKTLATISFSRTTIEPLILPPRHNFKLLTICCGGRPFGTIKIDNRQTTISPNFTRKCPSPQLYAPPLGCPGNNPLQEEMSVFKHLPW